MSTEHERRLYWIAARQGMLRGAIVGLGIGLIFMLALVIL